jgi:hypothetical protein
VIKHQKESNTFAALLYSFLGRWYRLHFAPALRISTLILLVTVAVDVAALHFFGHSKFHPFAADIVSALLTLVILLMWSVRHSQELMELDAYHRAIEAAMGQEAQLAEHGE